MTTDLADFNSQVTDPHHQAISKLKATLAHYLPINFPQLALVDLDVICDLNERLSYVSLANTDYKHCHLILCPMLGIGLTIDQIKNISTHLHAANPHNKLIISLICDDITQLSEPQLQELLQKLELADEIVFRSATERDFLICSGSPTRLQSPDFVIDDVESTGAASQRYMLKQSTIVPYPRDISPHPISACRTPEILGFAVADAIRVLIRDSLFPPPLATKETADEGVYLVGECKRSDLFQYVYYQGKVVHGKCEGPGKLIMFRPLFSSPLLINGTFADGNFVHMQSSHFISDSPYYKHAMEYFAANQGKLRLS